MTSTHANFLLPVPLALGVALAGDLTTAPMPLSISALVTIEGATSDGQRVVLLRPAWDAVLRTLRSQGLEELMHLTPRQWEELVAAAYDADGYEVELTPRSGDHGKDVIATKRGFACVRIIDQVKAYKPGHRVTANDVRALLGVLLPDANASKGIVTTTSSFAPRIMNDPNIAKHVPNRLQLIDGQQLTERLLQLDDKLKGAS